MKREEREKIAARLREYVERYPSQSHAAASLGIAAGTLSAMLNGKWDVISEKMWSQVSAAIGGVLDDWCVVETTNYIEITTAMADAQATKNVLWIVGEAGCGKTTAAKHYAMNNKEVYYILCSEDVKRGDFIREIARVVGVKTAGYTITQSWQLIMDALIQVDAPLLVFDEADKLTDNVFAYFVSLYNKLEDHAGIIFLSTDYIEKRIRLGLQHEKRGYKEIFSRIGRKYYYLDPASTSDVALICKANGVTSEKEIKQVLIESGTTVESWKPVGTSDGVACEYDFRRVKKTVKRTVMLRGV